MTSVFRWDPFAEMRNSMEALFDQGFSRPWRLMGSTDYQVGFPIELWETHDAVELTASLPGIRPDDVDISLTGDALTIRCEHQPGESDADRKYFAREIGYGRFQRTIALNATVDPDKAEARYENGMLHLYMPKAESARVRQIRVGEKSHLLN
jgi:HSP20 family protein